jgi:hypothetical protein
MAGAKKKVTALENPPLQLVLFLPTLEFYVA